jgi:hypothetical protein
VRARRDPGRVNPSHQPGDAGLAAVAKRTRDARLGWLAVPLRGMTGRSRRALTMHRYTAALLRQRGSRRTRRSTCQR